MHETRLRQIIYASRATALVDADALLQASRHNNALDGITGILLIDGQAIVQVLEGPEESVRAAFARISRDGRHTELRVLNDREIDERDFGYWSMEMADRLKLKPEQRARLMRRVNDLSTALQHFFQ